MTEQLNYSSFLSIVDPTTLDETPVLVPEHLTGLRLFNGPIHQSAIRDHQTCQRLYLWKHRFGLTPKNFYASPYEIGRWTHLLLSHDLDAFQREIARVRATDPPPGLTPEEFQDLITTDAAKALVSGGAFRHYGEPSVHALLTEGAIIARICPAALGLPSPEPSLLIGGRLDSLLKDPNDDGLWIVDYKTTSKSPVVVANALPIDAQSIHYVLLAAAKFPDRRIHGIIHNVLLKTSLKFPNSKVKDDDLTKYEERVQDWYEKQDMLGKSDPRAIPFVRSKTFVKSASCKNYVRLLAQVGALRPITPQLDEWPMVWNQYTCIPYRDPCPFLELCRACLSGEGNLTQRIPLSFQQIDPTKRRVIHDPSA